VDQLDDDLAFEWTAEHTGLPTNSSE